ncbi:MAG: ATPase, T2SS/T4P/T4SS family [Candidatus Sumerlaeia bacterium]|nr:ATPase, T2SS/T4P/T4SS family [Candidatus Sumerlaeia bacterium]
MANTNDQKKNMEMLIKEDMAAAIDKAKKENRVVPKGEFATRPRNANPKSVFPKHEAGTWVNKHGLPGMEDYSEELPEGYDVAEYDQASIIQSLTEKVGLPYGSIDDYELTSEEAERARSFVPSSIARDKRIFPLVEVLAPGERPILKVGICDALDVTIVDDIRFLLPEHDIEAIVIDEDDVIEAIDKYYGMGDESMESILGEEEDDVEMGDALQSKGIEIDLESLANDPPVIKLVNLLLVRAVQERASDLHIEPFAGKLRVRYRVDGVLREIPSPPKSLQIGLLTRLKVMAGLNIAESRIPQDGRIRLSISGKEIDLRVASVPTVYGESIVMRVLDKSTMMIGIKQLGFQEEVLESLIKEANKPNGIVLVTGPTGCGKTTTLYSLIGEVFDSGLKFITTEDPVEFELPGIVQVNINTRVKLTFAACLRSILRQDPDVIMVGEIRDVETAQIAIQAALTGHMVYSTLHTNSAAATVTRLVDMGIQPFLLTSTLRGVIGQRLIRTICPMCRDVYIPTDDELEEFAVTREEVSDITFYEGRGCDDCNHTGFKGRLGIYEFLKVTDEINELILQRSTTDDIHALAVHQGLQTMRADGWLKICLGVTTFSEVSRQTPRESIESAAAELASAKRSLKLIEDARRQRDNEDNKGFGEDDEGNQMNIPQLTN